MSFLNTLPLVVGNTTFIISEFTALDRLRDLEYSIEQPKKTAPGDNASDEEKMAYAIHNEQVVLDQVSHSIALSLFHSHPGEDKDMNDYMRILELQSTVKEQWPNRKVNEAYELLKKLNNPNFEPDEESEAQEPQDPPTPEKS
ncbi:phage minor tail protein domain-containing protein [Vibrio sp. 1982]|uniref:phage minor tail protein domain-containing protein n=1 Tax=Vibrio sp. 1982 TaxID=3074586 RepID=UPI0029649399|nr:phage minor tail protein G [Vibrio sp. 1982]MDW2216207.1 phage minor tail protein G [Vibrio sp. 1982]